MMTVQITCPFCASGVEMIPSREATKVECDQCQQIIPLHFTKEHEEGVVESCPLCERKDFYSQKDFNRKLGVILFVVAAILSIFTYGMSFVILYLFDLILFRKLKNIAICYKCDTIFRGAKNIKDISGFDHEMHDRIVYSDHRFQE